MICITEACPLCQMRACHRLGNCPRLPLEHPLTWSKASKVKQLMGGSRHACMYVNIYVNISKPTHFLHDNDPQSMLFIAGCNTASPSFAAAIQAIPRVSATNVHPKQANKAHGMQPPAVLCSPCNPCSPKIGTFRHHSPPCSCPHYEDREGRLTYQARHCTRVTFTCSDVW